MANSSVRHLHGVNAPASDETFADLRLLERRAAGRQKALRCPGGFDGFTNAGAFMGTEIIHDDNVARRQCRRESLLDISEEVSPLMGPSKTQGAVMRS